MKFKIVVPEFPDGLMTILCIDPATGEPLALDADGYDQMGRVRRSEVRRYLTENGYWDRLPVYTEDASASAPAI